MSDDLIKRLRLELIKRPQLQSEHIPVRTVFDEDADRIKELEHERDGIREAAWMEALDAAHQYTLMQYGMAFLKDPVDRARIIDMIGQRE
jgi:hypothetical protein